jgi:hypothetical protein
MTHGVSSPARPLANHDREQNAPPKTKYIEHILVATHSGEAGVGEVIRALQYRLRDSTWTIVFKGLITVHLMIREGSPDVTLAFLAKSRNSLFVGNFTDGESRSIFFARTCTDPGPTNSAHPGPKHPPLRSVSDRTRTLISRDQDRLGSRPRDHPRETISGQGIVAANRIHPAPVDGVAEM